MGLSIRDYNVTNISQLTSTFMNQVTTDFSNSIVDAFLRIQKLIERHNNYKDVNSAAMDWLIGQVNLTATPSVEGEINILGYTEPTEISNVQYDGVYGQVNLLESNVVSKIPKDTDDWGNQIALSSVAISRSTDDSEVTGWVTSDNLRKIVDGTSTIWMENIDSQYVWISIVIPISLNKTSDYFTLYPIAGTEIDKIKYYTNTEWTEENINTVWPVKLNRYGTFSNQIRVRVKGVNTGSTYRFAMRGIDIVECDYTDNGYCVYSPTQDDIKSITSLELNDPYIYPSTLVTETPLSIQILSSDESVIYYDSNSDTYPIANDIQVSDIGSTIKVKVSMKKVSGTTPYFKSLKIKYV